MKKLKYLSILIAVLLVFSGICFNMPKPAAAEEQTDTSNPEDYVHETFSETLIGDAVERSVHSDAMQNVLPDDDPDSGKDPVKRDASMPYTGDGHVLALNVVFPNDKTEGNRSFSPDDSEEDMQNALGVSLDGKKYDSEITNQYNNLHDFYQRTSFGKLSITGNSYSYSAKKGRDEYGVGEDTPPAEDELLGEVLSAMDETIDYKEYDANADGMIDGIVIHIPYDLNVSWGDDWWSHCSVTPREELRFDGVGVGSVVLLNQQIGTEEGHRTLIHEIGHSMGFPDYYTYKNAAAGTAPSGLDGILTFDTMNNNIGDHNGFSKWVAGWLDENNVTRVLANENGVRATRGNQVFENNEDGSVTLELSSYDSETLGETGGIIVVGNDDKAPFSSYFLIQYDTFAGNQKVYYSPKKGEQTGLRQIPSGFRVFRVQADLQEDSKTLIHNNTSDRCFDKLIELVDPDVLSPHSNTAGEAPSAFDSDEYGCMYKAGSELTPTSYPSTNFMEKITAGFTGISIRFDETNETSGKLTISWSDKDKPEILPLEIKLASAEAVPGGIHIMFTANQELALKNENGIFAAVSTNAGTTAYLRNLNVTENRIEGDLHLDSDVLTKYAKLTMKFQKGAFQVGKDESPAINISIPISEDLVKLSAFGQVPNSRSTGEEPGAHNCSPIYQAEDGSCYFYEFSNTYLVTPVTNIIKYTFDKKDPENLKAERIAYESEEGQKVKALFETFIHEKKAEDAVDLPEGAELGEYPLVYDAIQIGDNYYVASFNTDQPGDEAKSEMAVTKLDKTGKQIKQVVPVKGDQTLAASGFRRLHLSAGPNGMIAVQNYQPLQLKDLKDDSLAYHSATFFFDQDLNGKGRLDNNTTGCGTWLPDGRFLSFTQRTMFVDFEGKYRPDNLSYDITAAIGQDPVNQMGKDGTPLGAGASEEAANKAITSMTSDEDPAGTEFSKLQLQSKKQTKSSITLNWAELRGTYKYLLYGSRCGKSKPVKIATVTDNMDDTITKTVKKIAKKAIAKGTYYKFLVVALDRSDNVLSTSKVICVSSAGGKTGNYKSVYVSKTVLKKAKSLQKGERLKLNAKALTDGQKVTVHKAVRYESTNRKVAAVSKSGIVKGVRKGTCDIYAYAQNGVAKKIEVKVK